MWYSQFTMFDIVALVTTAGYFGITAIVFAESGLFFGFLFPGDSLLFTAGLLASQGLFVLWILVLLVVLAAALGDSVGYWTGKKIGPRLFSRPDSYLFSHQRVEQARVFFEKHGAMSIILARFIPAVRTFTPIIAGVAQMRYRRFLAYNIIGAFLWGAGMTLFGFSLGSVISDPERYVLPIVLTIIVLSLLPAIVEFVKVRRASHTHTP